ncbi:hypothetical protein N7509_009747 [Penicillium cosmopolitanum]|uniref:Uncharacterized protein n=1 Tax=Penicillium cosmopolitanum TaxID=1131564 RepID=A0A9W9VQ20_9EURO|nr:uncharacterized protein N7509_009747 [Penicillium cosmopolitanum]KAJ5387206.1 hypothetical protein N7509_009747 [Penicillium cosmopolitanum]
MTSYAPFTAAVIWDAVGREHAPFPRQVSGMEHQEDFLLYPLFALAMSGMLKYLSPKSKSSLIKFPGDHFYTAKAYSPPFDTYPRNITTCMSKDLTISAKSIAEFVVGGPAKNIIEFSPALIQWEIDDQQVGCVTVPTGGFGVNHGANVTRLEGFPGLDLKVKTNALSNCSIIYNMVQEVNELSFFNVTYTIPESFDEAPFISLQVV